MISNTDKTIARILLVDDEISIQESLRDFFELHSFNISVASTAEEGIDLLKNNTFDVVITDIALPKMNGLELTSLIKKEYSTDVIVITGYSSIYSYEEVINKGASDFVFKPVRYKELLIRLKRVLKEQCLKKDRDLMVKKLKKLATTDALTNLNNSRQFFNQVEIEIERSNRYGHPLSIILFDIDDFKKYNDSFGHLAGDRVLEKLGQMVMSLLRTIDSGYRYGGEEFTILLPDTNEAEAKIVAERLRVTVEKERFYPENSKISISISISAGVTQYKRPEEAKPFIKRADSAMYKSKRAGKNRVSLSNDL